ncbi:MAG TPA: hypothetical protein DHH64_02515 [Ruminococcaceae bacterium]|nr:hypothetical protein [Oscillospiraceae bacterium]
MSKLFCFYEDNLALAKFQCPTYTPLNHNLPQLLIKSLYKDPKNHKTQKPPDITMPSGNFYIKL